MIELNMDAGGPFLVPRTREIFDFNAAFLHGDDILCSQGEELTAGLKVTTKPSASSQGSKAVSAIQIMEVDEEVAESGEERNVVDNDCNSNNGDHKMAALRVGMPELRLRASISEETMKPPTFRQRLNRRYTHMTERFIFMRIVLNVVALEGPQRFIRPRSHQHWVHLLRSRGFDVSPMLPAVGEQVYCSMGNLPDTYGIRVMPDCVSLTICGRVNITMSLWLSS